METLKVNVTFQLVVPVRKDSAGRRLGIMEQVSPYISDYFSDLHTTMKVEKHHNYGPCKKCDIFDYDAQTDLDILEKMEQNNKTYFPGCLPGEESRLRWEAQKDLECRDLFKIGWKEFKTLSWTEQAKLRELHGVVWEDGNWVKARPEFVVRVNGVERTIMKREASYEDIVELSGSKRKALHSVVYHTKGTQGGGILSPGKSVKLAKNMSFEAVVTDNA